MNLVDKTCVELAKHDALPSFDADYAKVISRLAKHKSLGFGRILSLTGVESDKLTEILAELQNLSIVSRKQTTYLLAEPLDVLNTLVSLAEAKILAKDTLKEYTYAIE